MQLLCVALIYMSSGQISFGSCQECSADSEESLIVEIIVSELEG